MGASKWIAGVALALAMAPVAHATPSFPPGATGDWMGTLGAMGAPRRIFIHIHQRLSGEYVGAMDSLDRDYASVPITPIAAADDTLAFAVDGPNSAATGTPSTANGEEPGPKPAPAGR